MTDSKGTEIRIIGVGGAGYNVIEYLMDSGVSGVDLIIVDSSPTWHGFVKNQECGRRRAMSRPGTQEVTCPDCGHSQTERVWHSVNVTLSPDLKQRLFEDKINVFYCDQCESSYPIGIDLLYHDMDKKIQIYEQYSDLDMQKELSRIEEKMPLATMPYRYKRIVKSRNELKEKILIFDDDLDDRVIEYARILLTVKAHGDHKSEGHYDVFYSGRRDDDEIIFSLFCDGEHAGYYSISHSEYLEVFDRLKEVVDMESNADSEWLIVNADYVLNIFNVTASNQ
ncbi:MAG: CpXC domain-containing protein [Deltaproteobacteria bacterium]|jgi:transcription elongation factor Elf1